MDISFLIPTIREHSKFLNVVLSNIRSIPTKYSYEICVYGPEKPADKDVIWFEEKERAGQLYGFNLMAKNTNSDYLFCLTDDIVMTTPFDWSIEFLNSEFFKNRKYKITSLNPGDMVCNPVTGQIMGNEVIDFPLKAFPLCRFPILTRQTWKDLGEVIFVEKISHHGADNWSSVWFGTRGEICVDGPTRIISHNSQKDSSHEVENCNQIRKLWKKLYENPDLPYNYLLSE